MPVLRNIHRRMFPNPRRSHFPQGLNIQNQGIMQNNLMIPQPRPFNQIAGPSLGNPQTT